MTMREISGQTRLCGVIGDPVEHTVSPAMHNAAFKSLGINYVYVPFKVRKNDLASAVEGARALNIRGLNVTIPHKVEIIPLLDELDPLAEKIGAVNVIVNDEGLWKGYNTDADGFLRAMLEQGIETEGKKIVILGAGGASRAISFALAGRCADLTILNRTPASAAVLAVEISKNFAVTVAALELDRKNLVEALERADILVNTTSMGMNPDVDSTPVAGDLIRPRLTVVDIVYNPVKTRLLAEAEKAGARTVSGLNMLVWQGALAFEKWTGLRPPLELMRREAARALKRYEK